MPMIQIPSFPKLTVVVNTDHVTQIVLDERTEDIRLSIALVHGDIVERRSSQGLPDEDLRMTFRVIVNKINDQQKAK